MTHKALRVKHLWDTQSSECVLYKLRQTGKQVLLWSVIWEIQQITEFTPFGDLFTSKPQMLNVKNLDTESSLCCLLDGGAISMDKLSNKNVLLGNENHVCSIKVECNVPECWAVLLNVYVTPGNWVSQPLGGSDMPTALAIVLF